MAAEDAYAGAKIPCPACGREMVVPQRREAVAAGAGGSGGEDDEGVDEVRFDSRRPADEGLDMTPMVDVTFLLLIFFMVTAAYQLQKSLEVPAPEQTDSAAQSRTREEIENDDDYIVVHIMGDDSVWVNDEPAPNRHELLVRLREAKQGSPGSDGAGPRSLMVMADPDCRHETVIMALDAGNAVGMDDVRLSTVDDEEYYGP
jgi:biopolymer transport protein ExbD